ncbi:MAG: hypothetical protein KF744_15055 [Taibaiella sp.]|nr:hypothetical protein [Taibaiella sp.]
MKAIILSTSVYGTTGHHLQQLIDSKAVEIVQVVVSSGPPPNTKKKRQGRLQKILKIGILGAFNGIRMRKWYNEDMRQYTTIGNAEEICKKHNIPFCYVPFTNSDETKQAFEQADADVGLSLGNGFISKKIFSIPRYGMINIHHEILPAYQNAQSIIWQIFNGSTETGYTIHKITSKIDGGDILYQERLPIVFRESLADTVAFNYARLFDTSAKGLVRVLENFESYFGAASPQGKGGHYTTPSYRQYKKMEKQFRKLKQQAGQ